MFEIWTPDTGVFALARAILKINPRAQLRLWHGGPCPVGVHTASELQVALLKKLSAEAIICGDERTTSDVLPVGILCDLADRGLADSVEFRRLARRLLRPCRNQHAQIVAFLPAALAADAPRKQLAKILGAKLQTAFLSDGIDGCWAVPNGDTRQLEIMTTELPAAVHAAAEKILRTKLAADAVKHRAEG